MSGRYGVSQHGQLEFGYFYRLFFGHADNFTDPDSLADGMFAANHPHQLPEDAFRVQIFEEDEDADRSGHRRRIEQQTAAAEFHWPDEVKKRLCCPDPSHNRWIRRGPLRLKVWENNRFDCIENAGLRKKAERHVAEHLLLQLGWFGDGPRFSSRRLAEKINTAGLSGLRFEPTVIKKIVDRFDAAINPSFDIDVVEWMFVGTPCYRLATIQGAPNACPFCGFGPIVCNKCGHLQDYCPECGDYMFKPNDAGIPGLHMEREDESQSIVAGQFWDGSDAICSRDYSVGFVTRRFVEFLIAIKAEPFYAMQIAVCVDGMSREQLSWLDQAKDLGSLKL